MPVLSSLRHLAAGLPPIVILSSLNGGGAGIAALRLHQGLIAAGADVKMLVILKNSAQTVCSPWKEVFLRRYRKIITRHASVKKVTVKPSSPEAAWELRCRNIPLWDYACARWRKSLLGYHNRPQGLEMFTTADAPFNVAELDLVKTAGLINFHWCDGMLPWPAASSFLRNKPIVWTLHDMSPFTGGCHYSGTCDRWIQSGCGECPQLGPGKSSDDLSAVNFVAKRDGYTGLSFHIVSPSKWLCDCSKKSGLLRAFPHTVIANGFPLTELRPFDRDSARLSLGLPKNRRIILFGADACGNRRKGLHLLLEALQRLPKTWEGELPILVLFGNHSDVPPLPLGFECRQLGQLSGNAELSHAYSAADVFVLPSIEDNLPNSLIEAQACGTPAVGFAIGGIPDIISEPSLGRLAKPFDTADLADKIREILTARPEETIAFRKDCREHAEATYDQYVQTAAYLRLYRRLLKMPCTE